MKFLNKMERKFGRYAIYNLMNYVIILNVTGAIIGLINPNIYYNFLCLDFNAIFHGQIWRLFTFILEPKLGNNPMNVVWLFFELYLYYMIGNSLENAWGAFRFNLYYFSGLLLTVLSSLLIYFTVGLTFPFGLSYVNQAMFLAFAALYPNMQLLLFFILPIKVKWLGILYGGIMLYQVITYLIGGQWPFAIAIIVAMTNFLIFFFLTRNYKKISPREYKRRKVYHNQIKKAVGETRHKCTICGRTEKDDENLEFRYCSKCDGNYEYCMEHLFTHEHVRK